MNLSIDTLKTAISKKGYKWFNDRPNIIGIRSTLNVPDVFNDILCLVYIDGGVEKISYFPITTEPGVYYQKKLLNAKGCAVLKAGQYIDCYSIGFHQNKPDHTALVQVGKVTVYRDGDLDGLAEEQGEEQTGLFGINIHGAIKGTKTEKIGQWSAGCQVLPIWKDKEFLIDVCNKFWTITGNRFTYTLLKESDL